MSLSASMLFSGIPSPLSVSRLGHIVCESQVPVTITYEDVDISWNEVQDDGDYANYI